MTINCRVYIPGCAVVGAFAVAATMGVSVAAQTTPPPVREVQASDGTLYIIQGNSSWTIVPDPISDSDASALNPAGEIDGTFPTNLFVVQGAPPPATQVAPQQSAQPTPAAPPQPRQAVTISGSNGQSSQVFNLGPGNYSASWTVMNKNSLQAFFGGTLYSTLNDFPQSIVGVTPSAKQTLTGTSQISDLQGGQYQIHVETYGTVDYSVTFTPN